MHNLIDKLTAKAIFPPHCLDYSDHASMPPVAAIMSTNRFQQIDHAVVKMQVSHVDEIRSDVRRSRPAPSPQVTALSPELPAVAGRTPRLFMSSCSTFL
jgi:hypothetical protein